MGKNFWIPTNETNSGYPLVRHRVTKETSIFGLLGEIFQVNSTTYKMIFRGPDLSKIKKLTKVSYIDGDEPVITFNRSQLTFYCDLIKVPPLESTMVRIANGG